LSGIGLFAAVAKPDLSLGDPFDNAEQRLQSVPHQVLGEEGPWGSYSSKFFFHLFTLLSSFFVVCVKLQLFCDQNNRFKAEDFTNFSFNIFFPGDVFQMMNSEAHGTV